MQFDEGSEELFEFEEASVNAECAPQLPLPTLATRGVGDELLFGQVRPGHTTRCKLHRTKKNSEGIAEYNIVLEESGKRVATVKKEASWTYTCYNGETGGRVATIESTFFGNNFTLLRAGETERSLLTVSYETSFLGLSGPRRMSLYRPTTKLHKQYLHDCYPDPSVQKFVNKPAKWDESLQANVLDLKGRAQQSSIKNFVVTD